MNMPFGKHRGKSVHTLPRGYLRFLLTLDDLSDDLKTAVEAGIRGEQYDPPPVLDVDELVHEVCKPWEEQ